MIDNLTTVYMVGNTSVAPTLVTPNPSSYADVLMDIIVSTITKGALMALRHDIDKYEDSLYERSKVSTPNPLGDENISYELEELGEAKKEIWALVSAASINYEAIPEEFRPFIEKYIKNMLSKG